jgi:uncharacterized protein (TIGR02646 family)
VKRLLVELFHKKCAYCESKITHVDYGDIEHFRPKSGPLAFIELTFEWSNLLFACGICNGAEYKGDRFPDKREGGQIVNPCDDEPDVHLDFVFDTQARMASVVGKTDRGRVTIALLGLNRHDLRIYRSSCIEKLLVLLMLSRDNEQAARLLDEATRADAEYAAFARALVSRNSKE